MSKQSDANTSVERSDELNTDADNKVEDKPLNAQLKDTQKEQDGKLAAKILHIETTSVNTEKELIRMINFMETKFTIMQSSINELEKNKLILEEKSKIQSETIQILQETMKNLPQKVVTLEKRKHVENDTPEEDENSMNYMNYIKSSLNDLRNEYNNLHEKKTEQDKENSLMKLKVEELTKKMDTQYMEMLTLTHNAERAEIKKTNINP